MPVAPPLFHCQKVTDKNTKDMTFSQKLCAPLAFLAVSSLNSVRAVRR
jgi:hypothetical protein